MSTYTQRLNLVEKALTEIETYGWCRGIYKDRHGRVCTRGALLGLGGRAESRTAKDYLEWLAIAETRSSYKDVVYDLETLLSDTYGYLEDGEPAYLTQWNDDHRRKKDQVLALLRTQASLYCGLIEERKAIRRG